MADLEQWAKGISFSLFSAFLFYFYWDNIIVGVINFVGEFAISGVTDLTSIQVLKTLAWVNFLIVFLMTCPIYLIYSILTGSKNNTKTKPMELLKAIGIFLISSPFGIIIYVIVASLIASLNTATTGLMDAEALVLAGQFSWFIGLIVILLVNALPLYYILKGYGQIGGTNEFQ